MPSSWLHLVALTAYTGSLIGLAAILLPALSAVKNHESQLSFLARGLRFYNPLQTGALGILVISGAWQITELKAIYREVFLRELGMRLGLKLTLSFILVLLSVYQSMALAHRFVRRHGGGESISPEELRSTVQRLHVSAVFLLCLTFVTALVGIALQQR
jgi:hypothetical protein